MTQENIIYIGKKPTMTYVLAVVEHFQQETEEPIVVSIKARGRTISLAVDVAEIVKNRFVKDANYAGIEVGTENLENKEGRTMNVSFIDIKLTNE